MIKKLFLVLHCLTVAACAHPKMESLSEAVEFRNDENRILLFSDRIQIDSDSFALVDCTDATHFCKKSAIGFNIKFPKRCSKSTWIPEPNLRLSVRPWIFNPHAKGAVYINEPRSRFMYNYINKKGLVEIYFDSQNKILFDENIADSLSIQQRNSYRYVISNPKNFLFRCAG